VQKRHYVTYVQRFNGELARSIIDRSSSSYVKREKERNENTEGRREKEGNKIQQHECGIRGGERERRLCATSHLDQFPYERVAPKLMPPIKFHPGGVDDENRSRITRFAHTEIRAWGKLIG